MVSFDVQSKQKAVVIVQETWQDTIFVGEYPDFGNEQVAERGPYQLNAQYVLSYDPSSSWRSWTVVQVTYQEQPPEWKKK